MKVMIHVERTDLRLKLTSDLKKSSGLKVLSAEEYSSRKTDSDDLSHYVIFCDADDFPFQYDETVCIIVSDHADTYSFADVGLRYDAPYELNLMIIAALCSVTLV